MAFGTEIERIVRSAVAAAAAEGSLPAPPDIPPVGADGPMGESGLVRNARSLLAAYRRLAGQTGVVGSYRRGARPSEPTAPARSLAWAAELLRSPKTT